MTVSEMKTEEKESNYSGFERFLFFATPILFTIVLIAVLLTLFNANWRNHVLSLAEQIPIVNEWISSDQDKSDDKKDEKKDEKKEKKEKKDVEKEQAEQITELKALLASKDADLRNLADERKSLEGKVGELSKQLQEVKQKRQEETASSEEYDRQIKDLANMYAKMMPSKAAPVLENLSKEELVLVLDAMKQEDRVKVLEKMNPKVAAEASIMLKDVKPADDLKIKALQSRLKKNETAKQASTGLDRTQLSQTFANMTPKSGASILLETAKISPDKALAVLNAVDDAARSRLLNAMTDADKEATAKLVSKLLPSN
ncbi:primosomal protein [Paenibacillus sp. MER TA 81-3]|uniref:MotE family protein n=1 Tax=Paenibacillus sp. MER TA 81-3 TaxID=2939573 RepID=UPI00203C4533|nr:primosomal protein [Paenibacillus sp. MER TA 81-3]MCM3337305.1 primosomal protein [Paenibacillus sp. MER TA 81-3]